MLQERREQLHNTLLPILDAILVHALNAIPSCPIVMTRLIIILVIKRVVKDRDNCNFLLGKSIFDD